MKRELDEQLCKKYPKIFKDRNAPMTQTAMCWGIDTGDGWHNIIDSMCHIIQSHIDWSRKQRASSLRYNRALKRALSGDSHSLEKFYTYNGSLTSWGSQRVKDDIELSLYRVVQEAVPQVVAVQVKEKFGTLRFYTYGGDEYTRGVEAMAEIMSEVTCEECGSPGKVYTDGWYRVLCTQHAKEFNRLDEDEEV